MFGLQKATLQRKYLKLDANFLTLVDTSKVILKASKVVKFFNLGYDLYSPF